MQPRLSNAKCDVSCPPPSGHLLCSSKRWSPGLPSPLLTGFRRQPVTPGFFSGPRSDKMSGNGIDGGARNLACARLARHPYGPFACAQSPKFFPRASPTKEFSRPLFSGPRPDYEIKKENHLGRWFFFFRAGKGTRTLDPDLGKVVLYQLSYSREVTHI